MVNELIEIYLNDRDLDWDQSELLFYNAHHWAREKCSSYVDHDVQDVSDVSYCYNNVGVYRFREERDAMLFRLRWSR